MGDNDTAVVTVKKVPEPKDMPEMPGGGNAKGERTMPLTHDFHVMEIKRHNAPKAQGGSAKRPTKTSPLEYMKERQTDEAYRGSTRSVS